MQSVSTCARLDLSRSEKGIFCSVAVISDRNSKHACNRSSPARPLRSRQTASLPRGAAYEEVPRGHVQLWPCTAPAHRLTLKQADVEALAGDVLRALCASGNVAFP